MILTIIKAEILRYFCLYETKSYLCIQRVIRNKQSDADRSNMNGCQIITPKQGNSSNSFNLNHLYSLYRLTENMRDYRIKP